MGFCKCKTAEIMNECDCYKKVYEGYFLKSQSAKNNEKTSIKIEIDIFFKSRRGIFYMIVTSPKFFIYHKKGQSTFLIWFDRDLEHTISNLASLFISL